MAQYENEAQAITNLQTYLRHLSYFDPDATKVPIDGVFGSDTEKAVREFQRENGLMQTGNADRETWELIFEQYRASIAEKAPPQMIGLFPRIPDNYILAKGDSWFLVDIIQYMLGELKISYDNFGEVERTGVYDDATINAIKEFQRRNFLLQTGNVDRLTWNLLAQQFNIVTKAYEQ